MFRWRIWISYRLALGSMRLCRRWRRDFANSPVAVRFYLHSLLLIEFLSKMIYSWTNPQKLFESHVFRLKSNESRRRCTWIRRVDWSHLIGSRHLKHLGLVFLPNILQIEIFVLKWRRTAAIAAAADTTTKATVDRLNRHPTRVNWNRRKMFVIYAVRMQHWKHFVVSSVYGAPATHRDPIATVFLNRIREKFLAFKWVEWLWIFNFGLFTKNAFSIRHQAVRGRYCLWWKRSRTEATTESKISLVGLAPSTVNNEC